MFPSILLAQRARFNAKFAEARHLNPTLSADVFSQQLRTILAPLIETLAPLAPTRLAEITETLYDVLLDLVSRDFFGPLGRYPQLVAGWETLLPRLARPLAEQPRRVAGAITNALYNLSTTPGARPTEWLAHMSELAEYCVEVETLLEVGQIMAWRAGLAHYRLEALELCTRLATRNAPLARQALGLGHAVDLIPVIDRLLENRWLQASAALTDVKPTQLKIVAHVGAFRGFGGLFITPPQVVWVEGHFVVSDAEGQWLFTADSYGATFHRVELELALRGTSGTGRFRLDRAGQVQAEALKLKQKLPELANATSFAADDTTLAVTVPLSHAVYLVAAMPS